MYSILESELETENAETKIQEAGENFPTKNISYTTFKKGGQYQNVIIGEHDESIKITVGDKEIPVSIAWGYNGTTWLSWNHFNGCLLSGVQESDYYLLQ